MCLALHVCSIFYSLQPTECCASWCTLSRQGVGIPACAACLTLLLEVLISSPVSRRGTELVPANAHTALSRLHLVPAPALALGVATRFGHVVTHIVAVVLAAMAFILGVLHTDVPALSPLCKRAVCALAVPVGPENVPTMGFRVVHDALIGMLLVLARNVGARLLVGLVTQPHATPLLGLEIATCGTAKVWLRDHRASALLHATITLCRARAPLAPV